MKYPNLRKAVSEFSVEDALKSRAALYALRDSFVARFSKNHIKRMTVEEYAQGNGGKDSFCYLIERKLDGLGRFSGSPQNKFGVFYSKGRLDCTDRFGNSVEEAFSTIKRQLLALLDAGNTGDLDALSQNMISPMFKGKILATYFPDRYLNVFSDDHLMHFLRLFGFDTAEYERLDAIHKREVLVEFKNSHPVLKSWPLDIFGHFLYFSYDPRRLERNVAAAPLPPEDAFSYVDYEIDFGREIPEYKTEGVAPKPDYEKLARKKREYGEWGEDIVMKAEVKRLMEECGFTKEKADKCVIQISEDSDSFGYDIQSLNADGTMRYIEVKTTTKKKGDAVFFYTKNEYGFALNNEYKNNYYIYVVFEITSDNPKIWRIKNPFLGGEIQMEPLLYKVSIPVK